MTIQLTKIGEFRTGVFDEGAAEIPAYDAGSQRVFVVNGDDDAIDILDLSSPTAPTRVGQIDVSGFGSPNSVAVKDGLVAVAVESATDGEAGQVQFFDTDGDFLGAVGVGILPDMLTFTPDGGKVLVANEGEPVSDPGAADDPEGSITIITLGTGAPAERAGGATAQQVDFTAFNGREEDLRADGVRIFPNVSAAQDFEPEYIAVPPNGTKAFVTLQENNAVAIVDLASAEVTAVVPLGLKDHSKGLPSLTEFPITNLPDLGTTALGDTIKLGGFSGLWYEGTDADGNLKFATVPDRGPNGDVTADNERPFLLPEYQAQVVRFTVALDSGDVTIDEQLLLTREDGTTPITGLSNIPGVDRDPVDAAGAPLSFDPLGADLEGIVIAPDGTYWMVDEYRPSIYHFDTDGSLIDRFVPIGTADQVGDPAGTFGTETLPEEYAERRANRGFEAVALDSDEGILYAFIQTPLSNPDRATGDNSSVIRMLGIDPATGEPVAEYIYLFEKPEFSNVDKIGDAVYAGDGKFFVIERDSGLEPTAQKFVFEADLTGATNLLDPSAPDLPAGETLEQQTADSLAALGIEPVNKIKMANLPSLGYLPSDKPEGLALLEDGTLAVLNDNDFGLEPGAEAISLGLIRFDQPNGLDASNDDDAINIQNWPVFGMFMPDAIASFEADGATYFVTANEGDDRGEDEDIADLTLDPEAFPDAATLQEDENLGTLGASTIDGDLNGDGDFDRLQVFGARSFTVWDEVGNLVFDSGEQFAQITAAAFPDDFNSTNDENNSFDDRSDNKGAEPEGVIIAEIEGVPHAFIGLERIGGVMVYELSDPTAPTFVQYVNDRDFAGDPEADTAGDLGPEGFAFVGGEESPTGEPLLIVANEVSGSTAVYSIASTASFPAISDIQGAGHVSPFVLAPGQTVADFFDTLPEGAFTVDGETVTTTGIVTAVDSNGFYLQDAIGDGDITTSDALFVFTGSSPGVSVGDEAMVEGTVSEFFPGRTDSRNLPLTQITDPTIDVTSSGNPLPAAEIIGAAGRTPPTESIDDDAFAGFDPTTDGIDFFESLESMLVTGEDLVAVAGTNRFGEIFAAVDDATGATGISERGTLNISPDDFNPEKIQIDEDSGVFSFDFPEVNVGDFLGDVTGVISYSFGNFEILPTSDFTDTIVPGGLEPETTTLAGDDDTLSIASYNVLNLDPNDGDGDGDIADGRFDAIADQIVSSLNTPDVIALQEVQDNSGSIDDGVTAADVTLQTLVDAMTVTGGPAYDFIDNTFITDGASGGQPGGNIRTAFLYNPDRVDVVEGSVRPVGEQEAGSAFEGARLPLAVTFEFAGEAVTVINNHFSSKGGSAPILGIEQPFEARQEDVTVNGSLDERQPQSAAVQGFVQEIQDADANANVVVLGDLNEFEFVSPVTALETVGLTNLTTGLPEDERYSFIFQGNSQSLDHILVSDTLAGGAEFDIIHANTEFAETDRRASDHDPLVATIDLEEETPDMFTLQLLHAADQEAGIPALDDAPNFSGVLNALQFDPTLDPDTQTLVLSSGDAFIPGLVFNASNDVFGGVGFADILWQNRLGFEAITFGNHEFDVGLDSLKSQIVPAEGEDIAQFGLGLLIEEAQEVAPTPDTDAEGGFSASLNGDTLYVAGRFSDLTSDLFDVGGVDAEGNPESSVHIHLGDAGENGPILRNMTVTDNGDGSGAFSGIFTLDETEIAAILADGTYINLHTEDNPGGELRGQIFLDQTYDGAQFPYLSTNIDFSGTVLEELLIPDGSEQPNGAPFVNANSITSSIVIDVDGEPVGVVGATTPTLATISSPVDGDGNAATVTPQPFDGAPTDEQLDALAAEIQAQVDQLLADNPGMNKVVLQAHMQQLDIERGLAERLEGVDIIIGGGSNTRLFDENDRPRDGDSVQGEYPEFITGADGNPVALVNTDGNYKYVGRLIIDFDDSGVIVPESYDPEVSGAFATDDQGVADLNAEGRIDSEIQGIADLLRASIIDQESNVFGITEVYLNGLREFVRIEETNLGNLTADANLATAKETDPTVMVSLKNGGGIRDDIGEATVPPGGTGDPIRTPPEGIPGVKPDGGISQNDIANSLRFNNGLTVLTVTAEELEALLEHGFAASSLDDSNTQGRFPQLGGVQLSVDLTRDPEDRIVNAIIADENGDVKDVLIADGELVGDPGREIRMVTLSFLADGSDGYPFPTGPEANRVDLAQDDEAPRTGVATFEPDGSEQDALAEFLAENFPADDDPNTPAFAEADTPRGDDERIQNLAFREDGVAEEIDGGTPPEATLSVEITYFTEEASFANSFGIFNTESGEAEILETNTDRDTNTDLATGDILATLELTQSEFESLGFFLIANGDRRNDFETLDLDGTTVAQDADGAYGIQLADGSFLDGNGVFFSEQDKNPDAADHFQTFGTETEFFAAVEDLKGLGDQDFNDLVFSVTATEQGADALLS